MTAQEKYVEDHAALLGHVTLAWNDCHYMVLSIFHTLSGLGWNEACDIFLAQGNDHNRRGIVMTRMKDVLNTKNDEPIKEKGIELLDKLSRLAVERNLVTHTMWATVMPDHKVQPHPAVPRDKNLQDDFNSQFSNLTRNLRNLFADLWYYEPALRVHLESSRARAQ
jgi:hypothetical protein